MDINSNLKFRCVLGTVLLLHDLIILRIDAAPALNINESLNVTPAVNVAAVNKTTSSMDFYSGDSYLDEAYDGCLIARDMHACVKYRALKYIHDIASPFKGKKDDGSLRLSEVKIWGPLKLITLPPHEKPTKVEQLFLESNARSTDSELMRLFRFTLRQVERFVRAYALVVNVPAGLSSGASEGSFETPRLVDEDFFSGSLSEGKSRGKKKTMMYLLPLVSFFHLKTLLIPILLAVLFIKKVLVLAVVFLPSLLSLVKFCKPQHHHTPWYPDHDHPIDHHLEYSPNYGKEYPSRRRSRETGKAMAYRAYSNAYSH